jgi:hypothetical protein
MLHFAYGANMNREVMRKHAPAAKPVGVAALANHRFVITADGFASVAAARGGAVHGVLWLITPRDRVTLDVWESVGSGLYRVEILPVHQAGRRRPALVYIARQRGAGRPKPGYMELVVAAARARKLPSDYIVSLERLLPAHDGNANARKIREFGWT